MKKDSKNETLQLFRKGTPKVGVMGLGYVGLPLALTFAETGIPVVGFDIDERKCKILKRGGSYLSTVDGTRSKKAIDSQLLTPTSDFSLLGECDAILICVPTPLGDSQEPDLKYVRMTAEQIAGELRPNQLIVLESSTYPGTTEEIVRDILERSNKECGKDFWVGYSPEREDPGNPNFTTSSIPKLVSGMDAFSGDLVEALYRRAFKKVIRVSHVRVAEAAKIVENVYRAVNIALVNELKIVFEAMNIDVWEVIDAAASKPFGFQAFYPGPGLGGHCIPIDPFYLTWKAKEHGIPTHFIETAGHINTAMPMRIVRRTQDVLNDAGKPLRGSKVLLLGVAYKSGVSDTRESPGLELLHLLRKAGAKVDYHDPMVPKLEPTRKHQFELESVELSEATVKKYDLVLLATVQPQMDLALIARSAKSIVDTRNAFAKFPKAPVTKA